MLPAPARRPAARRAAALAAVALALPLVAAAASAAVPPAAVVQAPGRTPTLPSTVEAAPGLSVENSFVSSTGWVKPGEAYSSRILLTNTGTTPVSSVTVTIPASRGMSWTAVRASTGAPTLSDETVTLAVDVVPAASMLALVLESEADTLAEEPTLVWRDISSIASVSVGGGEVHQIASRGPKVIPAEGGYETARYGDRPFPVVPVDYVDFKHAASAAELDKVINDPATPSSTFNLYQEISLGQLFPNGVIGSVGVDTRAVAADDNLVFSTPDPASTNTCTGVTTVDPSSGAPTPLYTERISDGWYQLPGMRSYYGSDANGSALVGALAGVGALQAVDSGCGPAAKAAYDAAVVADPDIDYNDFDTDKDGVVDFFEVIFQGCGGNGASQLGPAGGCMEAPNDNIWPHSSSLESSYTDQKTGLTGYISKDQLKTLEGQPLWYTDDSYTTKTTNDMGADLITFVRVGPYNVNPETAIEFASVISHEYGHSLGLPDYYSTGSRATYGDFNLMATDKGQNMDVIPKKELGWIVPKVLAPGQTTVTDWRDSKIDTGTIEWVTPDGTPYTLSAAAGDYGIHNGEAYVAALPGRQLLDPAKIADGASGKQVWYSRQGNDFGCAPIGGHNLDVVIPGLADVPDGTPITATFKSFFDIEWDYDYGFVLTGEPDERGKVTYTSQESQNGYTTPATQNPNANSCQSKYGNGLTGTPASHDAGTAPVDRVVGNTPDGPFVQDSYDISELAGVDGGVIRFSYSTDAGLARLGWIIDDLVVKAGDAVLFESDFEDGDGGSNDPRVYPGGCKGDLSVSGGLCTEGWSYLAAGTPSELEHAYLLEMRDRSGFDVDGRGESDRGPTEFEPGVLLTYTDEAHGSGNVGTDNPPAQTPLDSVPEPENDSPNLNDATFVPADARSTFSDASAEPHLDNYTEPARGENKEAGGAQAWTFDYDCLSFTVDRLTGDTDNTADAFDLVGDVTFTTGAGCAPFNYGTGFATAAGQYVGLAASGGDMSGSAGAGAAAAAAPAGRAVVTRAVAAPLPRTGGDVLVALALGLVLVAGGSVLLSSRHRLPV